MRAIWNLLRRVGSVIRACELAIILVGVGILLLVILVNVFIPLPLVIPPRDLVLVAVIATLFDALVSLLISKENRTWSVFKNRV